MDTRARGGGSLSHINYTGWQPSLCQPSTRSSTCGLPSRASSPSSPFFIPLRRSQSFRVSIFFFLTHSRSLPPFLSSFSPSSSSPLFFLRLVFQRLSLFDCFFSPPPVPFQHVQRPWALLFAHLFCCFAFPGFSRGPLCNSHVLSNSRSVLFLYLASFFLSLGSYRRRRFLPRTFHLFFEDERKWWK